MTRHAALIAFLVAVEAHAAPPKDDMTVVAVEAASMGATGELYAEVWNGPEEQGAFLVQITTGNTVTKGGPSLVPGRKLDVVLSQNGEEVQRKSLALEGGSTDGKRRFALLIRANWERCVPIKIEVTISGQGKKATKSTVFPVQCGD